MNVINIISTVRKAIVAIENKISDLMFREKMITGRGHFRRNSVRINVANNEYDEEVGSFNTDSSEEWHGRFDSDGWDSEDDWSLDGRSNRKRNRKDYCDMV